MPATKVSQIGLVRASEVHNQRADFAVMELRHWLSRHSSLFLCSLPMRFHLRNKIGNEVKVPMVVHFDDNLIEIYPPAGMVLSGASFQAWEFYEITRQMRVDNIMEMDDDPGNGQMRSCVHFDANILHGDLPHKDVEIDIFKYPRNKNC